MVVNLPGNSAQKQGYACDLFTPLFQFFADLVTPAAHQYDGMGKIDRLAGSRQQDEQRERSVGRNARHVPIRTKHAEKIRRHFAVEIPAPGAFEDFEFFGRERVVVILVVIAEQKIEDMAVHDIGDLPE